MQLNGWLILDKPLGITSAHAVAKVKRLLRPDKIGHAGTLDPLASGILPLALGEATKTVAFMMDADKEYAFTVNWGEERDTDDAEGKAIATSSLRPSLHDIITILPEFTGVIQQQPPAFSAIKVNGQRAYDLARNGEEVALKAREVRVYSLIPSPARGEGREGDLSSVNALRGSPLPNPPPQGGREQATTFRCRCGKGTYIRSLARDMGRRLGCFGYISLLRRTRVGNFGESSAISLEVLEKLVHKGDLGFLQPVEAALDDIPAREVTSHQAFLLKRGQSVALAHADFTEPATVRARCEGRLVAICSEAPGTLKPVRVFNYE